MLASPISLFHTERIVEAIVRQISQDSRDFRSARHLNLRGTPERQRRRAKCGKLTFRELLSTHGLTLSAPSVFFIAPLDRGCLTCRRRSLPPDRRIDRGILRRRRWNVPSADDAQDRHDELAARHQSRRRNKSRASDDFAKMEARGRWCSH